MTKVRRHYSAIETIRAIDQIVKEEETRGNPRTLAARILPRLHAMGFDHYVNAEDVQRLLDAREADIKTTQDMYARDCAHAEENRQKIDALIPGIEEAQGRRDLLADQVGACRLIVAYWAEIERLDDRWRERGAPIMPDEARARIGNKIRELADLIAVAVEVAREDTRQKRLAERAAARSGPENAPEGHLCVKCGKRPRHFNEWCKRCVPASERPRGKVA